MSIDETTILHTALYTSAKRYIAIRKLAGHLKRETCPDEEVAEIASRADNRVYLLSGKHTWSDDDPKTPLAIDCSNKLAAAEILNSIGTIPNTQLSKDLVIAADAVIAIINEVSPIDPPQPPRTTGGFTGGSIL